MRRRTVVRLLALASFAFADPGLAQDRDGRPVGPCSPIAGPDGDVPSEMPGCLRGRRPADGSLADEMAFRRRRGRGGDGGRAVPDAPE